MQLCRGCTAAMLLVMLLVMPRVVAMAVGELAV